MCYDISFQVQIKQLSDYFPGLVYDNQAVLDFLPVDHFQGVGLFAPYPIIYINRQDWKPHCRLMEWSVIPYTVQEEPDADFRTGRLNIRSEKIFGDTKSYWHKIRNRRCLIPVTSIYEPHHVKGWKHTVPYNIRMKDQPIYFLPGLYSIADLPDKQTGEMIKRWTFGMITREGKGVMKLIHNAKPHDPRMVLSLPFELSKEFLQEALTKNVKRYKEILNYEMPSENLGYHPVFTIRGGKQRPDGKPATEYFEWQNYPGLQPEENNNDTTLL